MVINMAEIGKVIKKEKNLTVELQRTEACAKCRACSVGMKKESMLIECENICDAQINDFVEIVLGEKSFYSAVLIMYGLPFICFMIGLFGGYYFSSALNIPACEAVGFITGLICVIISYMWIRSKESYWKTKNYMPQAVKIVDKPENSK